MVINTSNTFKVKSNIKYRGSVHIEDTQALSLHYSKIRKYILKTAGRDVKGVLYLNLNLDGGVNNFIVSHGILVSNTHQCAGTTKNLTVILA